jgi:glycosyltransferase involved in cell wall biosynthesis
LAASNYGAGIVLSCDKPHALIPSRGVPGIRPDEFMASAGRRIRLLFFVTEDWYFCSHRLPLAVAAQEAGYDVTVVTRVGACGDMIRAAGMKVIPLDMARRGRNPIRELSHVFRLARIYRELHPDVVHHVAMKPVLYGTIAARMARVPAVVNALAGLGYVFSARGTSPRLLRVGIGMMLGALLRHGAVIVQNPDDAAVVSGLGVPDKRLHIIRGSGVDLRRFRALPEKQGIPVVVLVGRMLHDKGVVEFVEAARLLRAQGGRARFVLVGDPDRENPTSLSGAQLKAWRDEGVVEWHAWRDDMPVVYQGAHLVCLPSYREGLPKALLEAAASARAIVATDVPGCREIVRKGENGLLVPPRDPRALAEALHTLLDDPERRRRMGWRGREIVEKEFSLESVIASTLALYREVGVQCGHLSGGAPLPDIAR